MCAGDIRAAAIVQCTIRIVGTNKVGTDSFAYTGVSALNICPPQTVASIHTHTVYITVSPLAAIAILITGCVPHNYHFPFYLSVIFRFRKCYI